MGSEKAQPPSAARSNLKVVVVGGGITGLTLANIFARLGIDFVLLEAYNEIAPQVGASIGIFGGGMRVLDQIGCAQPLDDMVVSALNFLDFRIEGKLCAQFEGSESHFLNR